MVEAVPVVLETVVEEEASDETRQRFERIALKDTLLFSLQCFKRLEKVCADINNDPCLVPRVCK